jgi:hypothetical protein
VSRAIAEITIVSVGVALMAIAIGANQQWLDRHFLPSFFIPRRWYVAIETSVRIALAICGVFLVTFVRPRAGRLAARAPMRALLVAIAAALAVVAGELVLSRGHLRATEWLVHDEEPRRQPDPKLGWTFVPSRTGQNSIGGRTLDYAFDAAGYRVRRVEEAVDPERPTILFTGESVMFGEGLTWDESIPAQVGTMMNLQSANLAVHGYGSDQALMRLQAELPRFRHPVAVVSLFMTALFGRNLDSDRPHLGPGLVWLPPQPRARLPSIAALVVPYRSDATVARGVAMTRDVFRATSDLARARGATPLVVIPQFGREEETDRSLRRRVFDESGVPCVLVEINAAWRLSWDRHPNADAAKVIAAAIAERLRAH